VSAAKVFRISWRAMAMTTVAVAVEGGAQAARLSRSEVIAAVRGLTKAEKITLMKIARIYARMTPFGHDDLFQEAVCRLLGGTRALPREASVLSVLIGAMRSIAWQWRSEAHEPSEDLADPRCGEATAIASIDAAKVVEWFADDPIAQKIVIGMMDGARGEELLGLSGLGKVEYESKRRKIRRRFEKLAD
jgi:hypothetical protein